MSVYSMWQGPQYRGGSRAELFESAMAQPMSLGSTFWDQAEGGALESFGVGTAIRGAAIPPGDTSQLDTGEQVSRTLQSVLPGAMVGIIGGGIRRMVDEPSPLLSQEAYKSSAWFRDDIPWDAAMTEDRAAALATWYDAKKIREYFAEKRPITAFLGNVAGQAIDPINYIPVAGPAVQAAAAARVGRVLGTAATSSADAALNTAIAGLATRGQRRRFGDDVSWQTTVSEVATAALIGGAFGSIAGALGRRAEARLQKEMEQRLTTLKTTQEARIALNEAIGAVARGEDVALGPNAITPLQRVAGEVEQISRAYDEVRTNPTGPVRDPLVAITPEDIEGTIVARGAFKDINEADITSKRGWGLVKIILGHGEASAEQPAYRLRKADVVALPNVVRDYEPSSVSADGRLREWRVKRGGRTIVYADSLMPEGRHVVTAYVQRPDRAGADTPLSGKRAPAAAGSLSEAGNPIQDTDRGLTSQLPDGQPPLPAPRNIARSAAIDNSVSGPEPLPEGRDLAEGRIAKPDTYKALAEQYRVDPETGTFIEDAEIEQLRIEGRLTEGDAAELEAATVAYEDGAAYGEALKSVVGCLLL